jgi:hypothetical protein
MEPDRVLVGFVFNDVYHPYLHIPGPDVNLALEPATRLSRFGTMRYPGRLLRRSHLAHETWRVLDARWGRFKDRPRFEFEGMADQWLAWKPHPWDRVESLLGEMRDLLDERGVPLHLVVFPVSEQFDAQKRALDIDHLLYPQRRIAEIAVRLGIESLDLTDAIGAAGGFDLFADYVHFMPTGNDVIADRVEGWLAEIIEATP